MLELLQSFLEVVWIFFGSYLQTIMEIGLFQILFKMLMTLVSSEEVKDK